MKSIVRVLSSQCGHTRLILLPLNDLRVPHQQALKWTISAAMLSRRLLIDAIQILNGKYKIRDARNNEWHSVITAQMTKNGREIKQRLRPGLECCRTTETCKQITHVEWLELFVWLSSSTNQKNQRLRSYTLLIHTYLPD